MRRWPVVTALVIGLALVAAPVAFQMFGRAPLGGDMIDDFRPYMTVEQVDLFDGYMATIRAADIESREVLAPYLVDEGVVASEADLRAQYVLVAAWNDQWASIDLDMTDLLATMERNLDNYAAMDALPSFDLFAWFFVLPGLMIAGVAAAALWTGRRRQPRGLLLALALIGAAVVAAPAVFQMFTRAPLGGEMIDEFRPMMQRDRVRDVQGYFVTMGTAEGQLRTGMIPLAIEAGLDPDEIPAITAFSAAWPAMVGDLAAMVGVMSDNTDNFDAVDAMPPFPLFPWFFVVPGAAVVVLALVARRHSDESTA